MILILILKTNHLWQCSMTISLRSRIERLEMLLEDDLMKEKFHEILSQKPEPRMAPDDLENRVHLIECFALKNVDLKDRVQMLESQIQVMQDRMDNLIKSISKSVLVDQGRYVW